MTEVPAALFSSDAMELMIMTPIGSSSVATRRRARYCTVSLLAVLFPYVTLAAGAKRDMVKEATGVQRGRKLTGPLACAALVPHQSTFARFTSSHERSVLSVAIAPDDVATDHRVLLLV